MGKVRNPIQTNAPYAKLHLVPTGEQHPTHCIRCGQTMPRMGVHWTDDAAVHRLAQSGSVLLQLDTVDAAYNFTSCEART